MKQIEIIICALIISILGVYGGMSGEANLNGHIRFGGNYSTANQKTCFEMIRIITGSIEMYNMDVPTEESLKSFDNKVQEMLVEKRYLKQKKGPTEKCEYLSEGDLTKGGFIYCFFHGDIDNKLKIWNEAKARGDAKKHSNWFLIGFGIFISVYLLLSILSWLWKAFTASKEPFYTEY